MPKRRQQSASKDRPAAKAPKAAAADALRDVLGHSERVQDLVEQCADELSGVNAGLKRELDGSESPPGIEHALEKSAAVEDKVQGAAEELSRVNQALAEAVQEGQALAERLAVATREGDQARHAALHDPLTGLPNRSLFNDRLEHELAHARRHRASLVVMFVDLDQFKQINDTHGHDAGDLVLQTIAARLRAAARGDDTVCRHGGDEFLAILPEIDSEEVIRRIAEKIVQAIAAPFTIRVAAADISIEIRASIGIAVFPRDGDSVEALLGQADKAMYRAKREHSGHAFASDDEAPD